MKALLLAAATLSAVACASEPSAAVRVPAHKTSEGAGDAALTSAPSEPTPETTTTTEAPAAGETTTTTEPAPATTVYVAPVTTRRTTTTVYITPAVEATTGACGGSLPPCSVLRAESGGNIRAVNYGGCGGHNCYGKWQFDPRTSRGLGYPLTMDQYPESVQDDAARALWAGGRGCSHWGAC